MNSIKINDFKLLIKSYHDVLKTLNGRTILITGSTGMITTYLSEFLSYISDEYDLKIILQCRNMAKAKRIYGEYLNNSNINILDFNFEADEIPDIKPDYIIQAASPASTKAFIETPVDVISPNVIGTFNLLRFAKKINVKSFLFLSSNSIYGEGGIEKTVLEEVDYGIVDPLNDRSSYIESKRIAEQMCRAFYKQYGVNTSIIRICHTYGPTFDIKNDTRIIPRVIRQTLNNEDVVIYKDPYSQIQYTYIADMVAAILLVLLKGNPGEAYNAGGDEIVKMNDVVKWLYESNNKTSSKLIEKEIDKNYAFSKGKGVNFIKLSNSKLKKLGWKQLIDNKKGFTRTVEFYLNK